MFNHLKIIIIFLCCSTQFAKADNLYINADKLTINKQNNVAIYSGNVIASLNNVKLQTEEIKIFYNTEIKNIYSINVPTKVEAMRKNDQGEEEVVIANEATFDANIGDLTLCGNVRVSRRNSGGEAYFFAVEKLIYHIGKDIKLNKSK